MPDAFANALVYTSHSITSEYNDTTLINQFIGSGLSVEQDVWYREPAFHRYDCFSAVCKVGQKPNLPNTKIRFEDLMAFTFSSGVWRIDICLRSRVGSSFHVSNTSVYLALYFSFTCKGFRGVEQRFWVPHTSYKEMS